MADASPKPSVPPLSDIESGYITLDVDAETIARAEAEQQNEIVALNDDAAGKWKLNVGDAFHRQWQEITNALTAAVNQDSDRDSIDSSTLSIDDSTHLIEDKVFIISLLGNTSSGKSFVARHLLDDSPNNDTTDSPVSIDEAEKKGATTANINCYVKRSATNGKILVLDYEGEKGSAFPLFLYARRGLAHLTRSVEKAQHRRQAVTDYFPKLAYILSDVVILLGNDDLASTDYLTRCREFALKANDGVSQMVNRPLLIIIQNKASLAQTVKSDIVTQKFFDIHGQEAAALKPFFSDIKCFCLPHAEQFQRIRGVVFDGREIFDRQMTDMKELFATVRNRNSERSLTHAQWLYLLQRVLVIVHRGNSVSLHTLLSEIVARDDDQTIETIMRCFLFRYSTVSIHTLEWFANCCQFAVRVLAHCLAAKAYVQRELMSERIIHEQREKALQQLSIELEQFRPCEALYTGKGRSSKKKDNEHAVYCYQHKGAHDGGHRTCQSVYGLTPWKEFWGWSSTDVWPGEFVSWTRNGNNSDIFSENMSSDLSRMIRDLMAAFRSDPEAIYYAFTNLFRDCYDEEVMQIFCRICFCAPSPTSSSFGSKGAQRHSTPQQKLRRQQYLLKAQLQMMTMVFESSGFARSTCRSCCRKLYEAWHVPQRPAPPPITATFSQIPREASECAICYDGTRDFLFVPCGHRGFCESCADNLLRKNLPCPICRNLITGKQRVLDI